MGNRQSLLEQIAIFKPPLQDLILKDPGNLFKIYQHRSKGYELMAHKITLQDPDALTLLIDNFKARYQHHYLVSTLFLACEDYSACGGYYETIVFYQRVFTNLSKIKDIPFHDVLHFYAVAFKGFQILYRRFGYFEVYEDMFHLGQDSKLKVWCNRDISKHAPEPYLLDKNGSEEDMIRKIIYLISENTDPYTGKINLRDKLFNFGVRNFQMANQTLRQICRQYNLAVPERLTCISSLPSEEVRMMLDLYSSNSNYFSQNPMLSDSNSKPNIPLPAPNTHQTAPSLISQVHRNPVPQENLMTPHFHKPQLAHVPITQQFSILPSQSQISPVSIQHFQQRPTQMSMIHTFNRKAQMPSVEHRRGIELSLTQNREKKPSWFGLTQNREKKPSLHSRKLSDSRNKSLPIESNQQNLPRSPKFYSLEKKPAIKINFVNNQNGWVNPMINGGSVAQRFDKTLYSQKVLAAPSIQRPMNEVRQNYHAVQPNQVYKVTEPSRSRVVFGTPPGHQNNIRINYCPQQPSHANYTPILTNSILNQSQSQKSVELLKKSGTLAQNSNGNLHKSYSTNNLNSQGRPTYQPLLHQFRQRRASSKQKGSTQQITLSQTHKIANHVNASSNLQRNLSNQALSKVDTASANKQKQFEYHQTLSPPQTPINQVQNFNHKPSKLYLQVPSNPSIIPHQFNAHSASSRYLLSNREPLDNIPDIRYKKLSSPKKTINKLFDTKMQQLQSFNESKFGTQNSLKEHYNQNSRVLEIIGRDKKDSITSAFGDHQPNKRPQPSKQYPFESYTNQTKVQTSYQFGDSFTDPKILQILKRPSSKALKTELSTIKKISKSTKPIDFSHGYVKKPFISKEVRQDMLKLQSWQINGGKSSQFNSQKSNLLNFQGFPSLSNLSQINKIDQNSFNEEIKSNLLLGNKKNLSAKSKFSEQKARSNKKDDNAVSEFYNFDYQSPTYDYSFSSKRQIPIQDNEWRAKYATTTNQNFSKDDSTMHHNKASEYREAAEKPFSNYLPGFRSNDSLASLEYELSQKLVQKNDKDAVKEMMGSSGKFAGISNESVEVSLQGGARKYNPKIDPEISRDLERFRKQRNQPLRV